MEKDTVLFHQAVFSPNYRNTHWQEEFKLASIYYCLSESFKQYKRLIKTMKGYYSKQYKLLVQESFNSVKQLVKRMRDIPTSGHHGVISARHQVGCRGNSSEEES